MIDIATVVIVFVLFMAAIEFFNDAVDRIFIGNKR